MEDRELENICKSSIYSRIEKDARFNFPGGNLPVEEGIRRVSTRQFAVLIEADAALMKRSNRVFRLKNGPLEMKSSVAEGCFLRSRHSINSLFLFFLNELRCLKDRGCRSSIMLVFLIHSSILLPFFFDSFRYLKFPSSMDHIQVYVLAIRCIHFYWNKRQSGLSDRNNNGMVFKINRRGQKNLIKSSREREKERDPFLPCQISARWFDTLVYRLVLRLPAHSLARLNLHLYASRTRQRTRWKHSWQSIP